MNYYEVKLEYDIPDWGTIFTNQHYKELLRANSPLEAIDQVKDWVRNEEGTSFMYYSDGEADVHWRVSCASRVPVPDDCLFFDDRVVIGDGWVSDGSVAVPEGRAMWIEEYLRVHGAQKIDFEKDLISQVAPGQDITFSGYGRSKDSWDWPMAIFRLADHSPIYIQRHYFDFASNQLAAVRWQLQPFTNRSNGDACVVAYDADGQAVTYAMPFVGEVEEE